ncbi:MAG: stringent starvation protein B [Leptonema sp. (in: Bacteria)]|nr:stringent starvation protein B [Leptonema sp. (in: bacteria)]
MSDIIPEDLEYNRRIKRALFESLFEVCETFYVQVMPHSELVIGMRGLVGKEKEEGIVMVFGPYSARRLSWDEWGVSCDMHFNGWEIVHIPWESITRIFDKEGQFFIQAVFMEKPTLQDATNQSQEKSGDSKSKTVKKKQTNKAIDTENKQEASTLMKEATGSKANEITEKVIEVDFTNRRKK